MFKPVWGFARVFLWLCAALPAAATDLVIPGGGTLAHIVGGGPWVTTITLINLTGSAAPYVLHFLGDDGQPMTLATTAGTGSQLSGNLGTGASLIIETNGSTEGPVQQGWAYVETQQNVWLAGSAVFRLTIPGSPVYEASLPLDTDAHKQYGLPFDHVDATTGFAMANSYSNQPISVTLTFYDEAGAQFFADTFTMPGLTHQAFMLPDRYPQVAGKRGLVLVTSNGFINVVGLRARGGGFTTITPLVVEGW
jgi:hypothetical protein